MADRDDHSETAGPSDLANAPSVRETRLARLLLGIFDQQGDDHDVVDLLDRLVHALIEAVPAAEAGMLLDGPGGLELVASTDESAAVMELFQVNAGDGPCVEAVRVGHPVVVTDLDSPDARWGPFARRARALGFSAVLAVPMRIGEEVIGGANLFCRTGDVLDPKAVAAAQVLVDAAAIAVASGRRLDQATSLAAQLEHALASRVVVEQAKGILAEHAGIDVGEAFELLRGFARGRGLKLGAVAGRVVGRTLPAEVVVGHRSRRA